MIIDWCINYECDGCGVCFDIQPPNEVPISVESTCPNCGITAVVVVKEQPDA